MNASPSISPNDSPSAPPSGAYTQLDNLLGSRFIAKDLRLGVLKPARSLLAGNERTRYRGRGMDFEEVRLYQAGDDIRSIDWRVTARTQVPHTKLYREERERPIFMLVDQRSPMFFGSQRCFKSVLAAYIASVLAWAAMGNSDRVGGMVFGDRNQREIHPRRSKHAVLELIHQLQDYNHQLKSPIAAPDTQMQSLAEALAHARRAIKPGSAVFILSDFHDMNSACERELFSLARHADLRLIHLFDPLEQALASQTPLTLSDGVNRLLLPTQERRFQQAYSADFAAHLAQLTHFCQHLGMPLMSLSTADDCQLLLRQTFAAGRPASAQRR